jgi:hypothetical protein
VHSQVIEKDLGKLVKSADGYRKNYKVENHVKTVEPEILTECTLLAPPWKCQLEAPYDQ